jgi:aspartyl-tRNA(Asn)/glutamyl-tRNA(Gln) amidotransferase subunit C
VLTRTAQSLGDVLTLIDQLQAADTAGVEPMAHPLDAVQRLRADVVSEPDQRTALQAIAPAVADGLFLVPKVIE